MNPIDAIDADYVKLVSKVAPYPNSLLGRAQVTIVETSRQFLTRNPSDDERAVLKRAYDALQQVIEVADCLVDAPSITSVVVEDLAKQYPAVFWRIKEQQNAAAAAGKNSG